MLRVGIKGRFAVVLQFVAETGFALVVRVIRVRTYHGTEVLPAGKVMSVVEEGQRV